MSAMAADTDFKQTQWSMAFLCVFSGALRPEDISMFLGRSPRYSHARGQPVASRNSNVVRHDTAWVLESGISDDQDLLEHIKNIISFIEQKREAISTLQLNSKVEIRCGCSSDTEQGGMRLTSGLLTRLARLSVDLVLDLYPPGPLPSKADSDVS